MKFLIPILTIVLLAKDCKGNSQSMAAQKEQETIEVTYIANTRGFYEYINITKNNSSFSKDRDLNIISSIKCSEEDWNDLLRLISKIDLTKIVELEPPSKKFQFDGAAMATLELKTNEQQVKTPIFDHGNPPETITKVVAKVLSIKDKAQIN